MKTLFLMLELALLLRVLVQQLLLPQIPPAAPLLCYWVQFS
jgi:hypothetical protein